MKQEGENTPGRRRSSGYYGRRTEHSTKTDRTETAISCEVLALDASTSVIVQSQNEPRRKAAMSCGVLASDASTSVVVQTEIEGREMRNNKIVRIYMRHNNDRHASTILRINWFTY